MTLRLVGTGASADVFDVGGGRALKAFRLIAPAEWPKVDATLIPAITWTAERNVFERLQAHPELAIFVPEYFGTADPGSYPLPDPERYAPGRGILFELIPGEAVKFGQLPPERLAIADRALDAIQEATGADDPWDGSCFDPGTRAPVTVIDFANPTQRLEDLDTVLRRFRGHLPDDRRRLLGI